METNTLEEFRAKFRVEELSIFSNESWTWSLRPALPTLGASIISLNRFALQMSDVSPKEMADLEKLIKVVEGALSISFDYKIMNYLMLMMVDHHVHYHVIPRYDGEKEFMETKWIDSGWPALPAMGDNQNEGRSEISKLLINFIKSGL